MTEVASGCRDAMTGATARGPSDRGDDALPRVGSLMDTTWGVRHYQLRRTQAEKVTMEF